VANIVKENNGEDENGRERGLLLESKLHITDVQIPRCREIQMSVVVAQMSGGRRYDIIKQE
jgi:hypothetical protein